MTSRSRTLLFLSYRDSLVRSSSKKRRRTYEPDPDIDDEDENAGLLNDRAASTSQIALDIPTLPPQWVDISDEVEKILEETQTKSTCRTLLHST